MSDFTRQVIVIFDNPGKGPLVNFFRNMPTYPWVPNDEDEFIVPLTNDAPPNSGANTRGWGMAAWVNSVYEQEFVDAMNAMPPGLANQTTMVINDTATPGDFDAIAQSVGLYRIDG